jgi:hypothetical protein
MQFNVQWLKQWVAIDLDAAALAERLQAVFVHRRRRW